MKNVNVKVLVYRAAKTFIQAALAVLAVNLVNITNIANGKAAAVAAAAAGISAVMNLFIQPQEQK